MSKANTVCIDFDWTLCSNDTFGKPNKETVELIKGLKQERYEIIIYTSRKSYLKERLYGVFFRREFENKNGYNEWKNNSVEKWLNKHKLRKYISDVIYNKPEAVMYIDDRAIRFGTRRKYHADSKILREFGVKKLIQNESKELLK